MSATDRPRSGVKRKMKDHLASWRLSADPGANARRRKVIGGRIYDDGRFLSTDHRGQPFRKMREANGSASTASTLVAILCAREMSTGIGDGLILARKWSVSPVKER
jgi:hypothetical protein